MSDVTTEPAPVEDATEEDERLAYRGVFQRLFIRPEIGALIGAVGIWVFFWAVSTVFGTANGAAGILDVAATLGIMAVVVSMLMIGGEFDLSSGAMTGAMGMLVVLLVKETGELGGAGLSLWLAIPISLAVALGIGFFNGWMVEKTALPSFIITLGTFFVLRGAKLGFSKLIVDQIQVGRTDEGHGYDFWRPIFAGEWDRTTHQLEARDAIYSIGVIGGFSIIAIAVYIMFFKERAEGRKSSGLIEFVIGVVGVVVGIFVLHATDDTAGNWAGAIVIAISAFVGFHGLSSWRFEPLQDRGKFAPSAEVQKNVGLGVLFVALAIVVAAVMDAYDDSSFIFPFTVQGFRATVYLIFSAAGASFLMLAAYQAKKISATTKTAVSLLTAVLLVIMAFFVQSESQSVKFRAEAFSDMLVVALLLAAWAVHGSLFVERRRTNARVDATGVRLVALGMVLAVIGFTVKLLFTTNAEIEAGMPPAKFSMRIVWFIGVAAVMTWVLAKTKFGSWTFAVGGNKEASRQVGVPAARTKTQLFMLVSAGAWLVGMLLAFRLNTIQAGTGDGLEFQYIIAAVVGGTLLTGGYGSAFGGAIGALIISMATLGIPASRWNSDWRFLFLGVILLLAVIANRSIRTKAEALR
ncbi:MAG: ABC transporter permease [Acidimicrobiales bacterium]